VLHSVERRRFRSNGFGRRRPTCMYTTHIMTSTSTYCDPPDGRSTPGSRRSGKVEFFSPHWIEAPLEERCESVCGDVAGTRFVMR
jgi:hypothetical protein